MKTPINRVAYGFTSTLFLCLALFHSAPSLANEDTNVELKFWSRSFSGTIAGKDVKVDLEGVGNHVTGNYCYKPCDQSGTSVIQLGGKQKLSEITLTETASNKKSEWVTSGQWKLRVQDTGAKGTWLSPDGKKSWPIALTENNRGIHPFPFEIRLLASAQPVYGGDGCPEPPSISEIRLYRNDRLVQKLPAQSKGTCGMFLPQTVDINFDGYPDLMLAETLPAGPNIPYNYWIYNPAKERMAPAPEEMGDVTSPDFDPVNKIISVNWRASCCEHGVTTYKWKGQHLVQIDTASSYFQPEMIDGKLAICYVMPAYQNDGKIAYPDAVHLDGATLRTTPKKLSDCGDVSPDDLSGIQGRVEVQVWSKNPPSSKWLRTEALQWKKATVADGKSMYCPNIPVFNNGKIEHRQLTNADQCSDTPIE